MAQDGHPGLEPDATLYLRGNQRADPSKPLVAKLVHPSVSDDEAPLFWLGPFCDNHDRGKWALAVPSHQGVAHGCDVKRLLGYQDLGCAARDTCGRGNPAGVSPHHLADDDPVM